MAMKLLFGNFIELRHNARFMHLLFLITPEIRIVFALPVVISGSSERRYRGVYLRSSIQQLFDQVPGYEVIDNDFPEVPPPPDGTNATEEPYETCTSAACILQEKFVCAQSCGSGGSEPTLNSRSSRVASVVREEGKEKMWNERCCSPTIGKKKVEKNNVLKFKEYERQNEAENPEGKRPGTSPKKGVFALVLFVSGASTRKYRIGDSNSARQWIFGQVPGNEVIEDNDISEVPTPSNGTTAREKSYKTCTSAACLLQAESLRLTMNPNANPCDDFYEYACGGWTAFWDSYISSENIDAVKFGLSDSLLQLHARNHLGGRIEPTDIKPVRSAKMFYTSCLRAESRRSSPALHVVKKILDQYGGWPIASNKPDSRQNKWQHINDDFIRDYGIDPLYSISLAMLHETDHEPAIVIAEPSTLSLDFQIDNSEHLKRYQKKIADAAKFFAKIYRQNVSEQQIKRDAEEIVQLQKQIVETATRSLRRSRDITGTVDLLQRVYDRYESKHYDSKINWLKTIRKYFIGSGMRVDGNTNIKMTKNFLKYLPKLVQILDETPTRTVVNYVYWRMISEVERKVYPYVIGMDAPARWYFCINRHPVIRAISYAFAAKNYVSEEVERATHDLVTSVREKVAEQISRSGWMDKSTKRAATNKLLTMKNYIGFKDFNITEEVVIRYYKGLVLTEDYEQNILSWIKWIGLKDLWRSTKSISFEKRLYSIAVNAFYERSTNSMYIPAWVMKFSLIGPEVPEYISLGTMGAVIGHEISHAFDSEGMKYDGNGHRENLSRGIRETCTKKTQCFVDQYNSYSIPELSSTKPVHINGFQTRDENIADAAGLSASFAVLSKNMKRRDFKDLQLPGFENLTAAQLFFLSYGNMECARMTYSTLEELNAETKHTTHHMRVNGAISNSVKFGEAFNCPVGSKMNPETKCNIWN